MPYIEPSVASSSLLGLPRFKDRRLRDAPPPSSSSSSLPSRHPNRYVSLAKAGSTPATEYSPKTVYPPTIYDDSPLSAQFRHPVPPLPAGSTSHGSTSAPIASRRPPPLDLTELLVLQAQPRDDIPVLSLTPSPRRTTSFAGPGEDPFASSLSLTAGRGSGRRRASPSIADGRSVQSSSTVSHIALEDRPVERPPRQTRFSLAPVSAWIGKLGLGDAEKSRARKAVSREMRKLEGDRRELDRWDREREAEEEREWIWRGVAAGAVAGDMRAGVKEEQQLRPWSPLQIKEKKDPWALFKREKEVDAGDGGAGAGGGHPGPNGADIADAHEAQRKKRRRNLFILAVIVILLLLAGLAVILYKVLHKSSTITTDTTETTVTQVVTSGFSTYAHTVTSTSTRSTTSSTATSTAAAAASSSAAPVINLQSCLSDFPPSNVTSYCNTCNTFLTSATNDWTTMGGTPGVGQALQWCGLRAMYEATSGPDNTLGWFESSGTDGNICGWNGITCDQEQKVIQLNMTYPGVPSTLPSAIGNLIALQTLYVSGSTVNSVPSGSLPSTIYSLANLTSLSLIDTAISSAIPNTAFSSSSKLQSLVLVGNAGLGSSLPSGLAGTGLTSLVVQGQSLSGNPIGSLPKSLTYLDVSLNSLSSLSSVSSLTSLRTLLATSNALNSLPDSFPSSLATLSLARNSALSGQLPSDLCESPTLTKCDVSNTQLKGNINSSTTSGNTTTTTTQCGVCTF